MKKNAALALILSTLLSASARGAERTKATVSPLAPAAAAASSPSPASQAAPSAAPAVPVSTVPSVAFARLADDYWDGEMRRSPLWATFVNYPRYHNRLDDISAAGRETEKRELGEQLARLTAIDRAALSESERVSWDILKLLIDRQLEAHAYKFWQYNVDHMDGAQSWIPSVIETAQPMKTAADAEALLTRLRAMPIYFAVQSANLREGLKEGRVAARVPVEKTIRQLQEMIETPADKSPYAAAARRLPPELQKKYLKPLLDAVEWTVKPGFRDYRDFLEKEYIDKARVDKPGLAGLPGGDEAYRFEIRWHTTVDKTADELHQAGLDELQGIHDEMRAVAKRMRWKKDLKPFLEEVRSKKKNFFKKREDVQKTAEELVAKCTAKLPLYFGRLPKTPLVVQRVPDYQEKNEAAARYYPPPDDLSRPGIYYINTYQPETRAKFSMTSLAAHEGVPGHHLQIALALEERGLPAFRRNADFTAFIEGWALYSERLADEMGLYEDDLSRLGMLSDQALRASRLVVDTGLHAKGWSRQQAIDFMKENTPMSEEEIVAEVDRYIVWPGQALAYKVGQREITAIRKQAQAKLGAAFDIKAFHDAVLKNGAVPLPVLRKIVLGE